MKPVIYTKIPESDPAFIARAAALGVADLHEALGPVQGRMCLMSPAMRPIVPGQHICGPAVTAFNYPGDNLMIHAVLDLATAGQVMVLTNGGSPHGALWGDVACTFAVKKGVAGVVVHGAVRDTAAVSGLGFPVWSTAISVEHPEKRGPGAVNVPVVVDGVLVEPGDIVVADNDGVLVIPRRDLQRAVETAEKRAEAEVGYRARIAGGEALLDILNMRQHITNAGIETRDAVWTDDQ